MRGAGLLPGAAWGPVCLGLVGVLILSLGAAVGIGTIPIPAEDVYRTALWCLLGLGDGSRWGSGALYDVVWLIRMPRVVLAAGVGMSLSACGAVMQAVVRNPLADPYILGVSSGAYLGAALALGLGLGGSAMGLAGCVGGFSASLAVLALARLGGRITAVKLLLAGSALSAVCGAAANLTVFLFHDDRGAAALLQWTMGGFGGATWPGNGLMLAVTGVGVLFFWSQFRSLNLLMLGEETAMTLGLEPRSRRLLYLLMTAVMVGISVYQAGMIGFVGLMIPHMIRLLFGGDHRRLIPLSALTGGIFLVWADVLCRVVLPGNELPVGILTALVGAPVFVALLAGRSRRMEGMS